MYLNMKRGMKMRGGFMCQSPVATAVLCMTTGDPQSVIVPPRRRNNNTTTTKYTSLVEPRRFGRSNTMQSIRSDQQDIDLDRNRKPLQLKPSSLITSSDQVFQVVVMRVSLHCQGCAGKVKKHLSKMEGVTSFSIDLETKRVTVMGHVSPVGVLESISKVKRAEFWPC